MYVHSWVPSWRTLEVLRFRSMRLQLIDAYSGFNYVLFAQCRLKPTRFIFLSGFLSKRYDHV